MLLIRAGNAVAECGEAKSALETSLEEMLSTRSGVTDMPSIRSLLCPMPSGYDPSMGVGYVLGGMRGAGTC